MSIVVLEAGAASTPVLATDQCGLNEIEDIGGGCIVPVSVEGLHDGLQKMLSERDELKEMGKKLKSFVLANYTWDAMAGRLIELYKSILMPD
jgi:glycosyltransferase involved in cell wall biosynthesis